MSRFLVEKIYPDYEFAGYNYEDDAEWMHENYDTYTFIDVTPTIQWLENNKHKNIIIIDHHTKSIDKIIKTFNLQQFKVFEEYVIFNNKNILLYFPTKENISACKLYYLIDKNYEQLPIYKHFVNYISTYDTWKFNDLENSEKEELLNIIESLKVWKYDEFEKLLNSLTYDNYRQIYDKLNSAGAILRIDKNNSSKIALDRALYHIVNNDKKSVQLFIGDKYPDYELSQVISNNIPTIYISYSIDFQKTKATFSVRYYPVNNMELPINALKIAERFGGGGHPNAAGFSLTLGEFTALLKDNFQAIKNIVNKQ